MVRTLGLLLSCIVVTALATPAHAFSKARSAAGVSPDSNSDSDYWTLNQSGQSAVHTLDHSVVVFHYDALPNPTASYIPPNDPSGLADVTTRVQNGVWNANDPQSVQYFSDWLGYGFYAAIDPLVSYIYGRSNEMGYQAQGGTGGDPVAGEWRLVALTLSAGTKYLDLANGNVTLSPEASQVLAQSGCDAGSLYDLFLENTHDKIACRAPMRKLLSDLGIGAVLYSWSSASTYLQSLCSGVMPQDAFYVTEETVAQSQVTLLTSGLPPGGQDSASELRGAINSMWQMIGNDASFRPWPALTAAEDPTALKTWARANLFGCGP